jgi:murein DD-endopeptidase MepM/ murein hydrolase activator NlpD
MKKKVYFRYNPQTLSYERVYPSHKSRIFAVLKHLVSGILIGYGVFWLLMYFTDSPKERILKKENKLIVAQYNLLSKRLDEVSQVLKDIQQRDDNLYRAIFHADPIPSTIRNSGFGGVDRYQHLRGLPSSDLIIQSTQKLDLISKQIYIQSNSFDEIVSMAKQQKHRIECVPSIQPVANKSLKHVASGYGMRIDPIYGSRRFHAGMDFTANIGTPVYATGNGRVVHVDWKQGYGKCIIVEHGFGYQTLYAHLNAYKVRLGQQVSRGQQIGEVGNTGKSTGPHLHYEVHVQGKPDNPAKYYFMDLTPAEYDQMLRLAANHGRVMD